MANSFAQRFRRWVSEYLVESILEHNVVMLHSHQPVAGTTIAVHSRADERDGHWCDMDQEAATKVRQEASTASAERCGCH